jgi:hypothetical protein
MRNSEEAASTNLARAAALLDSTVTAVLSAFAQAPPTGYEADVEANLMIHLMIRDAEGVAMLAREGPYSGADDSGPNDDGGDHHRGPGRPRRKRQQPGRRAG